MVRSSHSGVFGTDLSGRCFLSYRRSQLRQVESLAGSLREHGTPTWQDVADLGSEPTVEAIESALNDRTTAGGLLWLSPDVADSPIIRQEEAPRILRRARQGDGFRAHLILPEGVEFSDVSRILNLPGSLEDPSKTWNILKPSRGQTPGEFEITVAQRVMRQRLADLHGLLQPQAPMHLRFYGHAQAKAAFVPGPALIVDWSSQFQHRHAQPDVWHRRLVPNMDRIRDAVRTCCPARHVVADGFPTITTALVLGRAFAETSGLTLSWLQQPSGAEWSLRHVPAESGLTARLDSADPASRDLAVLVNIRADVEPAVRATIGLLPAFRGVLRIGPCNGTGIIDLTTPGMASHAARLIGNQIREARQRFAVVERIHLFLSGPVGLAMMLGQQLNAVGPVHTYEHDQSIGGVGTYRAAAILRDPEA